MAFSGSYDYTETLTAANVIALALRRLGVYDPNETIDSTEEANALITLNLILKEWSAAGADVWSRGTFYLFLTGTTNNFYDTSSSTSYFVSELGGAKLNAAAASGASTVDIDTSSLVSNTDLLFIELDDGTIEAHVANGNQSSATVTLTSTLGGAAASGNYLYQVTSSDRWQERFIDILNINRVIQDGTNVNTAEGGQHSPMELIGQAEYSLLSKKLQTGQPTSAYHERYPISSRIYVWPSGASSDVHRIEMRTIVALQDLDATTDNIYVPAEGMNALSWQLAAEMASEYGISERESNRLWKVASIKLEDFLNSQVEDASFKFEQERRPV